eukprot:gene30089-37249_t
MSKVAIVTGANKGIGFEVAKKIAENGVKTILACRTASLGKEAEQNLKSLGLDVEFRPLDISDPSSIESFARDFARDYEKLDILVNNAAIAFKDSDPTPFKEQSRPTIYTNFFGTLHVTNALLPLLRKSASPRIVNVASMAGHLRIIKSKDLLDKVTSETLTLNELEQLASDFVTAVEDGTHAEKGFPNSNYGFSKLILIAATKIYARQEPRILINACCPGYCDTDMTAHKGPRTAVDGAKNATLLVFLPEGSEVTGKFYANEAEIVW